VLFSSKANEMPDICGMLLWVPPLLLRSLTEANTEFDAPHITNAKNMSRNVGGKSVVGLAIRRIIRIAFVFEHIHTHYFQFYY